MKKYCAECQKEVEVYAETIDGEEFLTCCECEVVLYRLVKF